MRFLLISYQILLFLLIVTASTTNNTDQNQALLNNQVIPAYAAALKTLTKNFIYPLSKFKTDELIKDDTNVSAVVVLARGLTCATKEIYNSLSISLNTSEQINQNLENSLATLMSAISQKERELRDANQQLNATIVQVANAQARVDQAGNDVRHQENEVRQAEINYANAQNALRRHRRRCGRRKKRSVEEAEEPVEKQSGLSGRNWFCGIFNRGAINKWRRISGANYGALNAARDNLGRRQEALNNLSKTHNELNNQQARIKLQTETLLANLTQLQTRQADLVKMIQPMRQVTQHLSTFASKSSVLYNELKQLVSFELLIGPINDISKELNNYNGNDNSTAKFSLISSEETKSITDAIEIINNRLPTLPFNDGNSGSC